MSALLEGRRRRRLMAEMNVVPYIDVMLVLLVIFMVTAPLLRTAVDVALPEGGEDTQPQSQAPTTLSLSLEGKLYLSIAPEPDAPMSEDEVKALVGKLLAANPKAQLLVAADKGLSYGAVMHGIQLLQSVGASSVGLAAEPVAP